MSSDDPSKTATPSSGGGMILLVVVALALLFAAVVIGRNLSRPRLAPKPVAAETAPTPEPAAPPEKPSVTSAERQEVLKRIDLMPNVTAENKERLYAFVERAQHLERLMTVSFEKGRTRVSEKEAARVVKVSKQTPFAGMAHNPAAIFVVLGYADQRGDEKKNMLLSTARATSVMELLRKQCGVQNVIQTVPMGSPLLFDPKDSAENRVAEIWTLQP